ncbi:MAG: electron transport complex subunit RsxC [Clostridia bacterium]
MRQKARIKGGLKAPHYKNTKDCETIRIQPPREVEIPMVHHIGAPCEILVKKGDRVLQGQKIGDSSSFISAPVHASVSGIVKNVGKRVYPNGMNVDVVIIESDTMMEVSPGIVPPKVKNKGDLVKAIRESGLVGLGGAGFPTHVKLNPPKDKPIDMLVINAAECEPYITSDYREIMENAGGIIKGIRIVTRHLGIKDVLIGIEDDKPAAVRKLEEMLPSDSNIKVVVLKSRYPQGAEKMLVYALTKRKIPEGGLPSDAGVVVMNVSSVSFIAQYLKTGMPLINRRITVDGRAVEKPCNLEVPIGTSIRDILDFCGLIEPPSKILMGGPMMGVAQSDMSMPVLKQNNAILAFNREQSIVPEETACIRCGKCVDSCPLFLMPLLLDLYAHKGNAGMLDKLHVNNCIECGVCSYVCPAKIHLVQSIRTGKTILRNKGRK